MERGDQGVTLGVADVFGCVGFVEQDAARRQRMRDVGEGFAKQAPDDRDEVEGVIVRPSQSLSSGFVAAGEGEVGGRGPLGSDGEALIRDVGEGDGPPALGEPESMSAGAPGEVESAAGSERRARFDHQRIGFGGLGFASEKLRVPSVTIGSVLQGHLVGVTPVGD